MVSKRAVIYPNVKLGKGAIVEEFAIIGAPPRGYKAGELKTVIGANAVIRSHTVIYAGNRIGDDFSTGNKANIRELNVIGSHVSIGTLSVVEHHVTIASGVRIHTQAFIPEYSVLDEGCWIGPNVVLTNVLHPLCPKAKECLMGVHVKKGAKIGANATILPAVMIGPGALVGAGSVVVCDVPGYKVVAGNPAVIVKGTDKLVCRYRRIARPYGKSGR